MKYQGWIKTPPKELMWFEKLLGQTQGSPLFADLYTGPSDAGKGVVSAPYKSVMKFFPNAFGDEKQTTGDCTSHGTRNGIDITRAVDIDIKGEPEEWVDRGATEYIYGMRGHTGQGMNVTRACRFVHEKGFLVRGKYGNYDLSRYNSSIGTAWGRSGTPRSLQEEASKHPLRYFSQIGSNNAETEIRNALANGYGIVFGGNGGWGSRRDENGIAQGIGSANWSHCMSLGAFDDRCVVSDEPLVLALQSWGKWLDGGHGDTGPLPVGSAWLPLSWFIRTYVQRGECIVVGDCQGYPAKDLPGYGTKEYL